MVTKAKMAAKSQKKFQPSHFTINQTVAVDEKGELELPTEVFNEVRVKAMWNLCLIIIIIIPWPYGSLWFVLSFFVLTKCCVFFLCKCKQRMRVVKRALKDLGNPSASLPPDIDLVKHTKTCLLTIGNRISEILSDYKDPAKIKEWRGYFAIVTSALLVRFLYRPSRGCLSSSSPLQRK